MFTKYKHAKHYNVILGTDIIVAKALVSYFYCISFIYFLKWLVGSQGVCNTII